MWQSNSSIHVMANAVKNGVSIFFNNAIFFNNDFKFRYCYIEEKWYVAVEKYSFSINGLYDTFRNIFPLAKKGRIDLQTSLQVFIPFRYGFHDSNYSTLPSMHPCECSDISSSAKCRNCWNNDREFRACSTVGKKSMMNRLQVEIVWN